MAALLTAVAKVLLYHLPCAFEAEVSADIVLSGVTHTPAAGRIVVERYTFFCKCSRIILDFQYGFYLRNSFGSGAGCDNGGSVVDGFDYLALYAGPYRRGTTTIRQEAYSSASSSSLTKPFMIIPFPGCSRAFISSVTLEPTT